MRSNPAQKSNGSAHGIMAPLPQVKLSSDLQDGQTFMLRPGESIQLFVAKTRRGTAPDQVEGVAPRSAFKFTRIAAPANAPATGAGQWYSITPKRSSHAGQYDNVFVYGQPKANDTSTIVRFTLRVGQKVLF